MSYNKILVFENDIKEVPAYLSNILDEQKEPIEYWFNFSSDVNYRSEEAIKRISKISKDTIIIAAPSFVGYDNSFSSYLLLFTKLKQLNIKLTIYLFDYDGFRLRLLNFIKNESNSLKKEHIKETLKDVLDFHNIYEIQSWSDTDLNLSVHINFDYLMFYYIETHRKLERTKFKVIATGEIYETYHVWYNKFDVAEIQLYIENNSNNNYSWSELERIN